MTPTNHKSDIALQAVHWYVNNIYGRNISLKQPHCIEVFFKFVREHNDWILESYWNDFACGHNECAQHDQKIPLVTHQNVIQ